MVNDTATNLDSQNRVFSSYNNTYKFGVLPCKLFLNGNTFFVLRLHEYFDIRPYAAHVSNTPYGKFGKKFRFREEGLWVDEDEYYNPNNTKFISLRLDIPELIKIKSKPDFSKEGLHIYLGHIDLANYLLKLLRAALAFAWMFDRILILPLFLCGGLISPLGVIGIGHFSKQHYPNKCNADVYLNLGHMINFPKPDKFKFNF